MGVNMQDRTSVVKLPLYGQGGTFAYTGTAGASSAFTGRVSGVWVYCTSAAWGRVGVGVTATATDFPIPANQMVFIPVPNDAQGNSRLSVVQVSSGGDAFFIPSQ